MYFIRIIRSSTKLGTKYQYTITSPHSRRTPKQTRSATTTGIAKTSVFVRERGYC
ncbi:hypothetical protein COCVIDRAFT_104701 [Bipolaris victoriae FI3]|uniref:Uncharacterized protein n=2 Tax=Bipolaris TaxID=33194 RepID=W6Y455_COCC2|nr:uncharacterized protein COCCADRAFT_35857 [Bipolaris zeicola 26-R-13]XP_014554511.1 hypothetical protein COCVIDRAFT_104701 [Bipolaris victoriae FI3]EUC34502.1 hypothetical protein COCCADRAFT_35857 [Bipolaris zeicola 26-R-13]